VNWIICDISRFAFERRCRKCFEETRSLEDFEGKQWWHRKCDGNGVAGSAAALEHDRHDTALPDELAVRPPAKDSF